MTRTAFPIAALLLCACANPALQAPSWRNVDASTGRLTGVADLLSLAEAFPESAGVQLRLLTAAHKTNDAALVRRSTERLAELGYALSPGAFRDVSVHLPPDEAATLGKRFDANRKVIEESRLLASVPAGRRLVEGIAWDAETDRLFASSVVGRELLMMREGGWQPVPGIETGSVFGLAIDRPRRLLWMASGVVDPTPSPDSAFRGLIAIDLDTLRVVRRVPVPGAGMSPGDIAVADNGAVFASDPILGALYVAGPRAGTLEMLVPPGRLRSPQGLVPTAGGRLYVADYNYGLAIVDIGTGAISRLGSAAPLMLNGIDGLATYKGDLIAIQNGTSPRRILRLDLDRSGTRVKNYEVIEQNHSRWGEPTLGQVRGSDFIYVADAQWERFGDGGAVKGSEPLRPTAIRVVPLEQGGFRPAS